MLGAIYIGLSGMNAYSKGLQTIGNNVSNLNSAGFKSSWAGFSDAFNFGSSAGAGGGVQFVDPRIDFQQGELRQTPGELDLAIQGDGFLALLNGDGQAFARTGQFYVGEDGFITLQGTDYHLCVLDASRQPIELNLDPQRTMAPTATTEISFKGFVATGAPSTTVSNITVYDATGGKHIWKASFATDAAAPDEWTVTVTDENGDTVGESTLKFIGGVVDPTTARLTVGAAASGGMSVVLDFSSGVTSQSQGTVSAIEVDDVDGFAKGELVGVTVDADGQIKLTYSNGETKLEGFVAMADFQDPQMLERAGNGLFENRNGAEYRLLTSSKDGVGKLMSQRIEASNVDLSQQFGDLILVQRGFQASSQVVSVSNDMIQQLFGIQGR